MQLITHIFRKDARHLWKEIAVSLALLAWLTRMDWWRSGNQPDSTEGWMNVLLPLVWVYLTGLCVLQDPVPGERQFWLTLPHRRATLPSAKVLFVAAFIHLPYFVSTVVILGARGFDPLHFLPRLVQKQLVVLLAVTLPSLALASVSRNAMQFIIFAISIAGAAIVSDAGSLYPNLYMYGVAQQTGQVRTALALSLLAVVSAAVIWLQYRHRRTLLFRGLGLAGVLAAGGLSLWLPPATSASIETALLPGSTSIKGSVHLSQSEQRPDSRNFFPGKGVNLAIPVVTTGLFPDGLDPENVSYENVAAHMNGPAGFSLSAPVRRGPGPQANPSLFVNFVRLSTNQEYLMVMIDRAIYNSIGGTPVTLSGALLGEIRRQAGGATEFGSSPVDVAELGKCASSTSRGTLWQEDSLRLACESPHELPRTRVTLTDTSTGRDWQGGLATSQNYYAYPSNTWLSPLHRQEAFFHLSARAVRPRYHKAGLAMEGSVRGAGALSAGYPAIAGCWKDRGPLPAYGNPSGSLPCSSGAINRQIRLIIVPEAANYG